MMATNMTRRFFLMMAVVVCMLFLFPAAADAQSAALKGMRNKATSLQKEIAEKEKILKSSQRDVKSKLENLDLITAQIESRKALIELLDEEMKMIDVEIGQLDAEIAVQEKAVEESKNAYAESLRRARKYSSFASRLMFIFSADDFNTMIRRYRYANEYMDAHKVLADSLKAQIEKLESKRFNLEEVRKSKSVSMAEQAAEQSKLLALEKEQTQIIEELKKENEKVQAEIKKKRNELKKLNAAIDREIERILAEERAEKKRREETEKKAAEAKKGKSSSGKKGTKGKKKETATKTTYTSDAGVAAMSGSFLNNKKKMPVPITGPYLLVGGYGARNAVEGKGNVLINTGGITFEGSSGAQARCIFEGKVTAVYASDGYSFVLVRHGEYISVYCNLGNIRVKSGDSIKAGTIIGDVLPEVSGGNPRMLFQLRKEKKTLNPAEWLKM